MNYPPAHTSGITAVRECPRKWRLTDRDWGQGYTPRVPVSALNIGRLVHAAVAEWYSGGKAGDLMDITDTVLADSRRTIVERLSGFVLSAVDDDLSKDEGLIKGMMAGYEAWLNSSRVGYYADKYLRLAHGPGGGPAVEVPFTVEWDGILIGGKIDALFEDTRTGLVWVKEYKTTRSISEMAEAIRWDLQPILYHWATEQMGYNVAPGVLYDIILKVNPFKVDLLKNGLPTRALASKLKGTSLEIYLQVLDQAIEDTGADEVETRAKYANVIEELRKREPGHIRRQTLLIPPNVIDRQLRFIKSTVDNLMIPNARVPVEETIPYMHRWNCPKCSVKEVCRAIEDDLDWQAILDRDFVREIRK